MSDLENSSRVERAVCQKLLDQLAEESPDIRGALVSTVDGFEIAARLAAGQSPARMAAMTSSLLALGDAVSGESAIGVCQDVVIEGKSGRVLVMDVPTRGSKRLLTIVCSADVTLGSVLWVARRCANEIGARLDAAG